MADILGLAVLSLMCQGMVFLHHPPPRGLPEYLHRLPCSFSAISPVLRAHPIRTLTMGCDIRNTPTEWFDGSSNRFGIRSEASMYTIACPVSECSLVGKRPHCHWKQDVKWECVCQSCLHLIKNLSMHALLGNPSAVTGPSKLGSLASK